MDEIPGNITEAGRLLKISEKLLQGRDFNGSRDFAILAQEAYPFLDGTDQILAVSDVLIASEKRINNHHDWYAILQVDRRSEDLDLIKKQYRRLALLLHPDKNKLAFADHAFRLVSDAWAVLSDARRKSLYDNELSMFAKVDLAGSKNDKERNQFQQQKLPVRRGGSWGGADEEVASSSFWTVCPYCYHLYEYARVYEDCCLRCQTCQRAFHGVTIPTLPPLVAGKEAYHCCWSFFPLPSVIANNSQGAKKAAAVTDRQAPPPPQPVFSGGMGGGAGAGDDDDDDGFINFSGNANQMPKKRGRPRKNVHPW